MNAPVLTVEQAINFISEFLEIDRRTVERACDSFSRLIRLQKLGMNFFHFIESESIFSIQTGSLRLALEVFAKELGFNLSIKDDDIHDFTPLNEHSRAIVVRELEKTNWSVFFGAELNARLRQCLKG